MGWGRSYVALCGPRWSGRVALGRSWHRAVSAGAKSTYESPYGYERTWNAALRLVRVDNGWKITEKDEASGYLLFDYRLPRAARRRPGPLELVRARTTSRVSVLVQLPQMPHYHEQVILDALASKMRREYGDPPPPPQGRDDLREPPTDAPTRGPDAAPRGRRRLSFIATPAGRRPRSVG